MGYPKSKLFSWLQGADFYRDLHLDAIELLPSGEGRVWVEFGCGPGLFTRLAAVKGYSATGIDNDPSMLREARRIAKSEGSSAIFENGDVFQDRPPSADVVVASSLLALLDDQEEGFKALLGVVNPGGSLLIVEPTERMTTHYAENLIQKGLGGKRIDGLRIWSRARAGHAIDPEIFMTGAEQRLTFTPLLGGLVGAWLFQMA